MIPFRLFYPVYLKYFIADITLIIPCYFLFEVIIKYLDQFNKQISIMRNILMIICIIYCYELILHKILFGKYQTIVIKTKLTNISWKLTFYLCSIMETISILYNIMYNTVLNGIPRWIRFIIRITINYFVFNLCLDKYAKLEISKILTK